jgi:hypothetical protein
VEWLGSVAPALPHRGTSAHDPIPLGVQLPAVTVRIVSDVNNRQRKRKERRRSQHAETTRTPDRPAVVTSGVKLSRVENAHIVPQMYQRAWEAAECQVAVHRVGHEGCRLWSTRRAGARPSFYRRTRPQGTEIDDFEATLGGVEDRATRPLREVIAGEALSFERKGALAQLLGVQLMRSPTFFRTHAALADELVEELRPQDFKRAYLRSLDGDVDQARIGVREAFGRKTNALTAMASYSMKVANILAHMRWHILRFDRPLLAYSDQPVVIWPMNIALTKAFPTPCHGPLTALEVRAPLAPDVAVLMNWNDLPDLGNVSMGRYAAADLNAFTVGQADEEWMHAPGLEPEIPDDIFAPLSRLIDPNYDQAVALHSPRRLRAQKGFDRIRSRTWVNDIEVVGEEQAA